MNNVGGALNFNATLDLNEWRRNVDQIRRDLLGLSDTTVKETQSMDSAFRNLSIGVASYLSVSSLKSFITELINVRGEFQKTEIAFTTMLGNADQAKVLMEQMVDLAAKTPFGLQDVSSGAKQLLAFQVPANEVVDVLTRMGNIAAGLGVPLSRINLVYGQVKAKGKLAGDDLRQFTEAGIPMVAELAKKFNKTTSEITEMVSAGKIGFKDVQDVLFSMTNEGGMFFNLMEKQSASLSGRIANLGDSWDQMLNKIGEGNEGLLNSGIEGLTYLVENYQKVFNIIEGLVVAYGSYKAAVIVTSAAQSFGNRTIQSEIALLSISEKMKLGRAMVTQRQAEATLAEAQAERSGLQIKYATLQAEASSLAVKKQKAIALAMEKAQALGNAQVQLSLAKAELRAVTANGTAREILIATKNVEKTQNLVLAAQEEASITRKGALTIANQVQTNQIELKNVATGLSAAANTVETATETAQTAAKTANTIATARLTLVTTLRTAATRLATTAQALLNATMLNNPIVLVIAAAVALTYAYIKLRDTSTAASIAEKQLNDERQRSSKLIEELKNKTQELTSVINSDTSTKLQQLEAYKQMQKMYPTLLSQMDLETFKKMGSTEAQKKLNAEMDKFSTQNIRTNIDKAKKSIEEYTAKIEELNRILSKRNGDSGIYLNQLELAKKNLEAQKINLEKYNEEYRQRLENEKLSSMSLLEQKKYWEDQVKSINQEISSLEKSNAKKAEALDKVNNIHSLVKSTSIGLINWNISPLLNQLNKAQSEINKINNAQTGASIDKNKAYWEAQKKAAADANDAMSGKQIGSAAWNENIRKYREADEALKKYDYSDKELLKAQKAREKERLKLEKGAEKSYLYGSVSRYEQKISLLEDALKKSSGDSVRMRYVDKYGKERFSNEIRSVKDVQNEILKLREQRAEREKLIEVKSFQESIDETKRQIEVRDKLIQLGYSKEAVDGMFPDVKDKTFLQYLNEVIASLEKTSGNEAAENLTKVQKLLTEYKGSATFIENVNKQIDQLKSKFEGNELIDKLEEFRKAKFEGTTGEDKNTKNIAINKAQEDELNKQREFHNTFLKDKETFEQKKLIIEAKYNDLRKKIQESNASDVEKARQTEEANKAQVKDISSMSVELFQKTDLWVKAFGDLEKVGPRTLRKMRDGFKKFLDSEAAKALKPEDLKIVQDAYNKLDETISSRNPFETISINLRKYSEEKKKLSEVEKKFGKNSNEYNEQLETTRIALAKLLQGSKDAIQGVVGFTADLGGALGLLSQESQDALKNAQQLFDGIINAVTGYLSGDYAKMAAGILQMITSITKAMNGDIDRASTIRQWGIEIEKLKSLYEQLNKEIEKTAGESQLKMQRDLVDNLRKQQDYLIKMRRLENEKKSSDTDKMASYTQQIEDLNIKIEELADNFKNKIATVEFKDLSEKIAEALTSAFAQGEDAAKSFDKVVDDVMRNAVQNALKMRFLDGAAKNMVDLLYQSMGFGVGDTSDMEAKLKLAQKEYEEISNTLKNSNLSFDTAKLMLRQEDLEKVIANLRRQIAETQTAGEFDGLTTEERDRIKAMGEDAMKKYMEALKQYQDLFGQSAENAQGLKGDIKGITEKTAGALEGQINAMRIMQAEALKRSKDNLEVMRSQLLVQVQIEQNTRPLKGIYDEIKSMNSKIKNGLAGIP